MRLRRKRGLREVRGFQEPPAVLQFATEDMASGEARGLQEPLAVVLLFVAEGMARGAIGTGGEKKGKKKDGMCGEKKGPPRRLRALRRAGRCLGVGWVVCGGWVGAGARCRVSARRKAGCWSANLDAASANCGVNRRGRAETGGIFYAPIATTHPTADTGAATSKKTRPATCGCSAPAPTRRLAIYHLCPEC